MLFGRQLERFLEAVQGGTDDRESLLAEVHASCGPLASESGATEDLQSYVRYLGEFLAYAIEHQLVDDVRFMNLLTNAQDPYAQWMASAEEDRAGLLDQAIELLRDFRPMFE